jgi:hypothetical protein
MPTLNNNPLLLGNINLTRDERITKIKDLPNSQKDIPDRTKILGVIDQQLCKLTSFTLEEMNKYRFYSKKSEDTDNILEILDNQLLYMDIIESEVTHKLKTHRQHILNQKKMAAAVLENKRKDKRKAVYDAYRESEALVMLDKLPPDMVQYIISFLRPEIRIGILKDKYDIQPRVKLLSTPKAIQLRSAIQKMIQSSIGDNPTHYTGGKFITRVYNAVLYLRDTCKGRTMYNPNGYSPNDANYYVGFQLEKALECFDTIADYEMKTTTPDDKDEPNSLSNQKSKQMMTTLLKMYHLILYATRGNPGSP